MISSLKIELSKLTSFNQNGILRFFYFWTKIDVFLQCATSLFCSWVCESCQLDTLLCISSSQLYTTRYFFCSDSCRSRSTVPQPHSHEPFILLPRFTWAKVQKTSETKIGTQSIYSEITIREASIKMRETYKVLFFSILFICGRACILRRICRFKGPEEQ